MATWKEHELKILCSLNVKDNEAAAAYQKQLAVSLAKPDNVQIANQQISLGLRYWYGFRDFLFRLHNLMSLVGHAFLNHLSNVAGLAYGVGLIVDVAAVTHRAFKTKSLDIHFWRRLKEAVNVDEERKHRMVKNTVSFATNLGAFILTGGASAFFNIASFAFDVCFSTYKIFFTSKRDTLSARLTNDIHELEKSTEIDFDRAQEIEALKTFKEKLHDDKKQRHFNASMAILCALCSIIVFTALCFPATAIPIWFAVSCGVIGIIAGSGLTGIGPLLANTSQRLWDLIMPEVKTTAGDLETDVEKQSLLTKRMSISHSDTRILSQLYSDNDRNEAIAIETLLLASDTELYSTVNNRYSFEAFKTLDTATNDPNITTLSPSIDSPKAA